METYENLKSRLSHLFLFAKERGFSDEQVKIAKECATIGQALRISEKYKIVDFLSIVQQNKDLMKLNNALGLVLQYISDLLSPELPPNWFSISIRNRSYAYRMNNMIGVEDLFGLAGYTKRTRDFLSFPQGDKVKPDKNRLANLATEILLAREECLAAAEGKITLNLDEQPQPQRVTSSSRYELLNPQITRPVDSGRCESVGFTVQPHFANEDTQPNLMYSQPQRPPPRTNPPIPKPRTKVLKKVSDSSDSSPPPSQTRFSGSVSNSSSFSESIDEESSNSVSESGGSRNSSGVIDTTISLEDTITDSATQRTKSERELKKEALKKRLQELKKKEEEKSKPCSYKSQVPQPFPNKTHSNPDVTGRTVDSPSDLTTNKAVTVANPHMPPRMKQKLTTPPTSQTIREIDEEENVPDTPTKCPRCHGHLDESGTCMYCSPAPSPSGSIERVTPNIAQPPVPKPRIKNRPMTDIRSINRSSDITVTPIPQIPVVERVQQHSLFHRPSNEQFVDASLSTLKAEEQPGQDSFTATPLSTLTNQSISTMTSVASAFEYANRPEIDQKFMKFQKEAEYFATLSLEEQDEMLDNKIRLNDTTNHLKPFYKGRNWAGRKEQREIKEFIELTPGQQKDYIDQKNQRKEKISHLVSYYNAPNANQRAFDDQHDQRLRKKEKARDDGKKFCEWIKTCARKGYSPGEVEIAISHDNNPLRYLETKWQDLISEVITSLEFHSKHPGKPSHEEARKFLISAKGKLREATGNCAKERLAKIKELEGKFMGKVQVERQVLVECLSQCDLNVEEAFYSVQRRNLAELYKYLLSSRDVTDVVIEGGESKKNEEKGKTDMDAMKDKVLEQIKNMEDKKAYDSCVRMLMAENKFKDNSKAKMLIDLLKEKSDYPMKYYIDAAKHYDTFEDATAFLNQPCPICMDTFLMDDMVVLPSCGESLCKECFVGHFTTAIKGKSVKHFTCPSCDQPDFSNNLDVEDITVGLLVSMVKELCDKETYDLCQQKLTDFNLSKQPNFVWCINEECRSGFLTDRNDRLRVECPNCHKDMCFLCKKKWEHQHEGLTCDQFTQWKIDNDPEAQKQGLAAHLEENGIQCPACKFRYDLARGGCMHFRCTQCPNEFCSGCGGSMKKGDECGKFEYCKKSGLHAHHPRDCLFYLRDFDVLELQDLLRNNNVEFDIDPPKAQLDAAKEEQQQDQMIVQDIEEEGEDEDAVLGEPIANEDDGAPVELTCCVMLQKEGPDGLYDERCGKATPDKMAGLCETHYKEYLVSKINKEKVDPIDLYPLHQLVRVLEREEKEVPDKEDDDDEEDQYKALLMEHIKKELPLQR